jgi:hypothetical protein
MSRNGSGTYTLPAGNPVVTGTTITTSWANTTMQNIADGLTQSVSADGQTPMTGSLNMASNKIIALATPTLSTDATTKAYVDLTQTASGITGGTITGVALTNDTIDSTSIGATTPSTVKTTALTVTGATSGTLAIAATAIAGTNTATFPAATGIVMVSGAMPAFSASLSSGQNISNNTDTVVLYDTKTFDTATAYNTATGRFTPQVAGYYQINVNIQLSGSAITLASSIIRKNGNTAAFVGTSAFSFNSTPYRFSGSTLIYCNGSSDYIDTTAYVSATSGNNVVAGSVFSGVLVRSA